MSFIKMLDLHRQYLTIKQEIDGAIQSVLDSCEFIQGAAVRDFESQLAHYLQARFVIGCASGTDALQIALMALGIGPGDEVITTPFTFVATAETILLLGARPVYVDIDEKTYNIDPGQVEKSVTHRTKAIIPVHLYGQPADMFPLLELARAHRIRVIEDTAQSIGARYQGRLAGTLGDIGCFSFYPTKNLGACGDAGALVTHDEELALKCRMICDHGSKAKYCHEILGLNSRLDSLQAAILRTKLAYLEQWNEKRNQIARRYSEGLKELPLRLPYAQLQVQHVYHQYTIRLPQRDALAAFLQERGTGTAIHYPLPLHLQTAFAGSLKPGSCFPVAETAAKEVLCLPIYPELEEREVDVVISVIHDFFRQQRLSIQ
jgi:dTDP-4-amino-4,6-dideoxygalactose transaminase